MKRKHREINIFSMSALDLFASALGVFILLMLILMPFYLKTDKELLAELREQQKQNQVIQEQNAALEQEKQRMQAELEKSKQQQQALEEQLANAYSFALLGITTKAKSFVLLVDMSGSMGDYADVIEETVSQLVGGFDDQHELQIVGFKSPERIVLEAWQRPYNLTSMSASGRSAAISFSAGLSRQLEGGTPTHAALLEALKYDAEAIILMTDGNPNGDVNEIIRDVSSRNSGQKEIHSVAIGNYIEDRQLTEFLQELSRRNGGGFVGVSR